MDVTDFTKHKDVINILEDLEAFRRKDPNHFMVSDVVDEEGHQYVDLVQEGGGMLGIALVGYTYVLEQMGIRFVSLAGTSAGAINAVLLASMGKPDAMKSFKIIELLANKDFSEFVDGGWAARRLIRNYNRGSWWPTLAFWGTPTLFDLFTRLGINPGKNFHRWMRSVLYEQGIMNMADLRANMDAFPEHIHFRKGISPPYWPISSSLAIIATDLTTETKAVFPAMAGLYYENPGSVNPADFVRSSMSIPLFFEPFRISGLPEGKEYQWAKQALYHGDIPEEVILVDGGMLSNFAIDVFHRTNMVPTRPTFGVKLGLERNQPKAIEKCQELVIGCFSAACQRRDLEFILNHPDYNHLVAVVDVGEHDWMNFNLPDEDKIDLFVRGARTAANFLKTFNWEKYKHLRECTLSEKVIDVWKFADLGMAVTE